VTLHLDEILDLDELADEIDAGYVRQRFHPADTSYMILNYSEKAQLEKRWNDVTRTCRGLIARTEAGTSPEVIARPWSKFYNYGEHEPGSIDLDEHDIEVLDKVDGSLGIIYQGPDGWAVATRGSFESEQAIRGTDMLRQMIADGQFYPAPGWTMLAEIVFPANRIVLDYGTFEGLILLGAVHIATGMPVGPRAFPGSWMGSKADPIEARNLAEALALPPRPNAEGVVVRFRKSGRMVKIKQDDYVRLHKLVTGLSERAIWEHLNEHDNIDSLLEQIPDEFHDWVLKVSEELLHQHLDIYAVALAEHMDLLDRLDEHFERREYADQAHEATYPGLMFMLLDGKDTGPAIYKMIRPVGHRPMTNRNEEIA